MFNFSIIYSADADFVTKERDNKCLYRRCFFEEAKERYRETLLLSCFVRFLLKSGSIVLSTWLDERER